MSRILIADEASTVLAENLILAESTWDRMRGLLGRDQLDAETAMLLRPCKSIHMWFMRFPIDAAFIDKEMKVLKIARHLGPWQLAFGPRKTHCVLEAASGALSKLKPGDRLRIE